MRIGYVVADQPVADSAGNRGLLADELSKIKSMLTVNTSPITQAIVGGKLLENEHSLLAANQRERAVYTANMRQMVAGLAARFPDPDLGVSFTVPVGGFFVVVTVPFAVDDALLERSASDYGVLWTADAPLLRAGRAGARVAAQLQHGDPGADRGRPGPGSPVDPRPTGPPRPGRSAQRVAVVR